MTEPELLRLWQRARLHIIVSQLAPTFLLITTVSLFALGLTETRLIVRVAALGILLASGILGALVQFGSASEAQAVAKDLAQLKTPSAASRHAIRVAPWLDVVKYVTPGIFVAIFVLLAVSLFLGGGFR